MCINYKVIYNRKYTITKKNKGVIPPLKDKRQEYVKIPCKECYVCRKKKAREWRLRLSEDIKVNKTGKVILLTFNTESLIKIKSKLKGITGYELDNAICRYAVKHFRERWRKKYGRSIRHWLITELGQKNTEHVHMHGIVWEDDRYKVNNFLEEVEKVWNYGFVGKGKINWQSGKYINYVNQKTASYFTKYVTKKDEKHSEYKQIILTSSGIGKNFLESEKIKDNIYKGIITNQNYQVDNGTILPMPEYFRRKLYTDEEREKLTGWMLDKPIIYIDGREVDKNINGQELSKMLKNCKEKNARLGFGDGTKNYEKIKIENEERRRKQNERIIKKEKLKSIINLENKIKNKELYKIMYDYKVESLH